MRFIWKAHEMTELHGYLPNARERLGHEPVSPDDIVVMISDVLYKQLRGGEISLQEAIYRVFEILESPLALQIYENEMQRRNPRDADRWH